EKRNQGLKANKLRRVSLLVAGGGYFEDGEEGFLGDVDLADALHALFSFFLFFEKFTFAGNVTAVAFGEDVFADGGPGFAGDYAAADGGLNGNFEHLAGNQFSQTSDEVAATIVSQVAVNDERE